MMWVDVFSNNNIFMLLMKKLILESVREWELL
jgi:hypothetical protein